jgi:hypothetical protein
MAKQNLDSRQKIFVESRAKGMSRKQSAITAGYSDSNKSGDHVERGQLVQAELAGIRAKMAEGIGITKDDVAAGFKDAADMARIMSDPTGMVGAWRELGKLLGFYAPEVKRVEQGISRRDLLTAMDTLSDEDLQRLARGRVLDGEFEDVSPVSKNGEGREVRVLQERGAVPGLHKEHRRGEKQERETAGGGGEAPSGEGRPQGAEEDRAQAV